MNFSQENHQKCSLPPQNNILILKLKFKKLARPSRVEERDLSYSTREDMERYTRSGKLKCETNTCPTTQSFHD